MTHVLIRARARVRVSGVLCLRNPLPPACWVGKDPPSGQGGGAPASAGNASPPKAILVYLLGDSAPQHINC
jgi:hypothetical protein